MKTRWRRVPCPICGDRITNNALGRESHIRHCRARQPAKTLTPKVKIPTHEQALIAIQGMTITNLMDALDQIATVAHFGADKNAKIARMADDAIEAAKALTRAEGLST